MMSKMNKVNFLFYLFISLSLLWTIVVSFAYFSFQAHPYFSDFLSKSFPLTIAPLSLVLIAGIYLYIKKIKLNQEITINFSVLTWLSLIVLGAMFCLVIIGLINQIIMLSDIFFTLISLCLKVCTILIFLFLFAITIYSIGKSLFSLFKIKDGDLLRDFLYNCGLGFMVLSFLFLGLSLLGFLNLAGVLSIFIVVNIIGFKNLANFFQLLQTSIVIKIKFFSLESFLIFSFIITLSLIFALNIQPFPTGWDTMTVYFNRSKELAYYGKYIFGQYSYPAGLIYSLGFIIGNSLGLKEFSDMLATSLSYLSIMLAVFSLFLLGKQIKNKKTGLTAALIFLSMPLIVFFSSVEPKIENAITLFLILALSAFFSWKKTRNKNYLILVALFLGFAYDIKITTIFSLISLAIIFIYDFWFLKNKGKYLLSIIFSFFIFLLVITPWSLLHLWERDWKISLNNTFSGQDKFLLQRGTLVSQNNLVTKSVTGFYEDYSRYVGYEDGWWGLEKYLPKMLAQIPLARYLSLPWDVTTISNIKLPNAIISSLFLILLPISFIYFLFFEKKEKKNLQSNTFLLSLFLGVNTVIWIISGRGVIWYGMGILIAATILVAAIYEKENSKIGNYFLRSLLIINILFCLILELNRFHNAPILAFALGKINKTQTINVLAQGFLATADLINNDPQIQSGQKYVLNSQLNLNYFINNYRHVNFNDMFWDEFNQLFQNYNGDYELIKKALLQAKIKYIIYTPQINQLDQTEEKTLQQKSQRFFDFAKAKLKLLAYYKKSNLLVFEVTEATSSAQTQ
ncbi:hypothetical protein GYA19_03640 [Candidatus Beckwithbacteria bacterium]|nr:hypothetical protein [Candidatus Beckwithbacteria bacterium]